MSPNVNRLRGFGLSYLPFTLVMTALLALGCDSGDGQSANSEGDGGVSEDEDTSDTGEESSKEFVGNDWSWSGSEAVAEEVDTGGGDGDMDGSGDGAYAEDADMGDMSADKSSGEGEFAATDADADGDFSSLSVDGDVDGDMDPSSTAVDDSSQQWIPAGQLTAGEWCDLCEWDFFRGLMDTVDQEGQSWSSMETLWGFYLEKRISVDVKSGDQPVVNAAVTLMGGDQNTVFEARTDINGRAELFLDAFGQDGAASLTLVATHGDSQQQLAFVTGDFPASYTIELETAEPTPLALDLMLMVDTTGSMGDELSYIQAELEDVITKVAAAASEELKVRLSVNFYRDEGDQYIVRSYPFTTDIGQAVEALRLQRAGGGGDFPEAVHRALEIGIQQHEWSDQASTRLMFLVLDAPPHDDDQIKDQVRRLNREAAGLGIQIIPVSGSGIDKETEFLLRFMAVLTNGTYIFLTDDSGIGGGHLQAEPTIGEHDIELLNELMVRVIKERLGLI